MNGLPWFRMYTDFLDDPKLIGLAFEDQRHFIAVCALKCAGVLDQESDPKILNRIVAQRIWVDHAILQDVKKRLVDAGLIDENWQPLAWNKRQKPSDHDPTGAQRQVRYRQKKAEEKRNALRNGAVTPPEEKREEENREDTPAPPSFSFAKHLSEQYGYRPDRFSERDMATFKDWFTKEVTPAEFKAAHLIACERKNSDTPNIAYINGIIKNDRADKKKKLGKKKRFKPAGQTKSTDPLGDNTAAYEAKAAADLAAKIAAMTKKTVTQ